MVDDNNSKEDDHHQQSNRSSRRSGHHTPAATGGRRRTRRRVSAPPQSLSPYAAIQEERRRRKRKRQAAQDAEGRIQCSSAGLIDICSSGNDDDDDHGSPVSSSRTRAPSTPDWKLSDIARTGSRARRAMETPPDFTLSSARRGTDRGSTKRRLMSVRAKSKRKIDSGSKTAKKSFSVTTFTKSYPCDLSPEEQSEHLESLQEAVESYTQEMQRQRAAAHTNGKKLVSPLNHVVVEHLQNTWERDLLQMKRKIAARVAQHLLTEEWSATESSALNISAEEVEFQRIDRLLQAIDKLISGYVREFTVDPRVIMQRQKIALERKRRKEQAEMLIDKDQDTLAEKSPVEQLKFFVERYGPIKGRKEYNEWASVHHLADAYRSVGRGVDLSTRRRKDSGTVVSSTSSSAEPASSSSFPSSPSGEVDAEAEDDNILFENLL